MNSSDTPLSQARRALEAERSKEARDLLGPLLEARPGMVEAWLLLARARAALGEDDAAREAFGRCATLAPKEPVVWLERALFEGARGQGGQVVREARRAGVAQALATMVQAAASGKGARATGAGAATRADLAALSQGGNLRAVEARAVPLLRARPGAAVWGLLAQARLAAGRTGPAAEAFRQGLRLEPYAVDLRLGLVRALQAQGDVLPALVEARQAARMAPLLPAAQLIHGRLSLQAGLADRAAAIAAEVLARRPTDDAALALAAEAAMQAGRAEEALAHARARKPDAPAAAAMLAKALADAGRAEEALAVHDAHLARTPDDSATLTARGQLRQSTGDAAGAEADLRAAIAADPRNGTAYRALAYGVRLAADDPAVGAMQAALAGDLPAFDRRMIDYALGRALQRDDPDAAAAHLAKANASMLRSYPHDPRPIRAQWERIATRDWPLLRAATETSGATAAPIFVTGLPRSGTTLVEAILSSHPEVAAGGELAVLRHTARPLRDLLAGGAVPDEAALRRAGEAYDAAARRKAGECTLRLTDKSIQSFLEIGLIRAILPRARVVVVTRDPRDTGLSIWRNHFHDGTHRYAASQEGIADRIGLFHDAIAFWRQETPGAFHEIAYEALLDAPEEQARALLAACGLDWDARVLSFHERAGRVETLSFAQVRQPLYRSSRGGWQAAREEIAELIAGLEARGLVEG
ncbi:tetratricopeptide repeat-containing sulfotransferase family protein [Jannaschia rubra]|uniref:Putative PEP-CTERM system TPR-repeat lipoprotein n=1 Tax=Jannaschia rubra TaxID=282197 RepID=A0A0M6XMN6_9RHOB|nr:tetratricopeptide repeat-containing sulfotransferase family protein [Jannaschia rubra]CTQ32198.1 putative PEP-CTERM system TPR-repeat lipoprotein [Jannaschia rubra]SFG35281.1 Tetratricopeptide repeat-containing protein [Jannaschia rubra]